MTLEEIRELIKVLTDSGVEEIEVQRGDDRVRIRRGRSNPELTVSAPAPSAQPAATAPSPAPASPKKPVEPAEQAAADPSLVLVTSPIVGTFYESASPGGPPFVRIGETVQPGKVLCIIESMKLMNEIEAEVAGVITQKLVQNAQPVEYGEALFAIRPL